MSIIQKLEQKIHFTGTEIAIAEYILDHPEEMANMGIADLARNTFSSNAAIIRLCRKLDLAGYKEFRIEFVTDYEKIKHIQAGDDVDYPFVEMDSPGSIMRSIANISQSAIEECYASISPGRIQNAAKMINKADRIFIYAAGETLINVTEFSNLMMKIGRQTIYPARYLESLPVTARVTSKDIAIVVSYTGYILAGMQREIQILKRNRTPIIVISSLKECPEANILITIPDRERSVGKVAGFYSQSAIRYVLNCIYGNIYAIDMKKNREYKDKGDSYSYKGSNLEKRFKL